MESETPLLAAALTSIAGLDKSAALVPATAARPASQAQVTSKIFLDVRIIKRFDVEVLEDAAIRGRIVIGLFGKDAPLAVERFLNFVNGDVGQFQKSGGGPAYAQASFDKIRPGEMVEGGKINGLRQTEFAGNVEWEYMSRLIPLRPILEVNDLRHDQRGILTVERFTSGPEFGLTLGAAPSLDGGHEVIGLVQEGLQYLDEIEQLPYITGRSLEKPGSVADQVFMAQKSLFSGLSKATGDTRAEDRTGKLLRRVEITSCGVL